MALTPASSGRAAVVDVIAVVVVPRAFLWVGQAFVRGLDAGEPLGRAFDVVRVLVRVFFQSDFTKAVRGGGTVSVDVAPSMQDGTRVAMQCGRTRDRDRSDRRST